MQINNDFTIVRKVNSGNFVINMNGTNFIVEPDMANYNEVENFYNEIKSILPDSRDDAINNGDVTVPDFVTTFAPKTEAEEAIKTKPSIDKTQVLKNSLEKMIDFFSEFSFAPSYRFINTLAHVGNKSMRASKNFVANYFALTDSPYVVEVKEKIKSAEFDEILKGICNYGEPAHTVNNRLKIYYGAAGTGKTTLAQSETDNRCIVCNASMLPADLMEDFVFTDGHPDFNPSLLYDCMEKGLPIVLDEINLLPFDSLRFLQGITDGKSIVSYKNREIHIKEGFQIIGTMNLTLGGATYGLPEPLVDRCSEIREFNLTAEQLMGAIM
jgi:hypothetical protein